MFPDASSALVIRTGLDYASGSVARNGEAFDMAGLEGVLIVTKFADIAGTATIKAQQDSSGSAMGSAADLAGTEIAVATDDDNQIFILDIVKPRERYVRGVLTPADDNCGAMMWYVGYGAHQMPVTVTKADEVTYERHISPAEGTP